MCARCQRCCTSRRWQRLTGASVCGVTPSSSTEHHQAWRCCYQPSVRSRLAPLSAPAQMAVVLRGALTPLPNCASPPGSCATSRRGSSARSISSRRTRHARLTCHACILAICHTCHMPPLPYVTPGICHTRHMSHLPYVTPAICHTRHMSHLPYVTPTICHTCHMSHLPYATLAICHTFHMSHLPITTS